MVKARVRDNKAEDGYERRKGNKRLPMDTVCRYLM